MLLMSAGVDALCGSTLLIGIDELIEEGLLPRSSKPKKVPVGTVDYKQVNSLVATRLSLRRHQGSEAELHYFTQIAGRGNYAACQT